MNEQKKMYTDFLSQSMSEAEAAAIDLSSQIQAFLRTYNVKPSDWIALMGLIKQLERPKAKYPRKVLRGIEKKFNLIQQQYENQR